MFFGVGLGNEGAGGDDAARAGALAQKEHTILLWCDAACPDAEGPAASDGVPCSGSPLPLLTLGPPRPTGGVVGDDEDGHDRTLAKSGNRQTCTIGGTHRPAG